MTRKHSCVKDSFVTHRAFCDALAEESARLSANTALMQRSVETTIANSVAAAAAIAGDQPSFHLNPSSLFPFPTNQHQRHFANPPPPPTTAEEEEAAITTHMSLFNQWDQQFPLNDPSHKIHNQISLAHHHVPIIKPEPIHVPITSPFYQDLVYHHHKASPHLSATALLQKAATIGSHSSTVGHANSNSTMANLNRSHVIGFGQENLSTWQKPDGLTRDFLGLAAHHRSSEYAASGGSGSGSGGGGSFIGSGGGLNVRDQHGLMLSYAGGGGGLEFDNSMMKHHHHHLSFGFGFGAAESASETTTWGN